MPSPAMQACMQTELSYINTSFKDGSVGKSVWCQAWIPAFNPCERERRTCFWKLSSDFFICVMLYLPHNKHTNKNINIFKERWKNEAQWGCVHDSRLCRQEDYFNYKNYMSGYFACMCTMKVPVEGESEHWIPWDWIHIQLGATVWGVRNQTHVFWKGRQCSLLLSHFKQKLYIA